VGKHRKQVELENVIKFYGNVFLPIDQVLHNCVVAQLDSKLLETKGPIMTPDEIDHLVPDDVKAQLVLKEINGHKDPLSMIASASSFSDKIIEGYSACITRGNIGLISHTSNAMLSGIPLVQVGKNDYFSFLICYSCFLWSFHYPSFVSTIG